MATIKGEPKWHELEKETTYPSWELELNFARGRLIIYGSFRCGGLSWLGTVVYFRHSSSDIISNLAPVYIIKCLLILISSFLTIVNVNTLRNSYKVHKDTKHSKILSAIVQKMHFRTYCLTFSGAYHFWHQYNFYANHYTLNPMMCRLLKHKILPAVNTVSFPFFAEICCNSR